MGRRTWNTPRSPTVLTDMISSISNTHWGGGRAVLERERETSRPVSTSRRRNFFSAVTSGSVGPRRPISVRAKDEQARGGERGGERWRVRVGCAHSARTRSTSRRQTLPLVRAKAHHSCLLRGWGFWHMPRARMRDAQRDSREMRQAPGGSNRGRAKHVLKGGEHMAARAASA